MRTLGTYCDQCSEWMETGTVDTFKKIAFGLMEAIYFNNNF